MSKNEFTIKTHVLLLLLFVFAKAKGPSTKDVRQMGRGGGFEISDISGRGEGGGL